MMFNPFRRKKVRERLSNLHDERIIGRFGRDASGGQRTYVTGEKYAMRGNPNKGALMAMSPIKMLLDRLISNRLVKLIPFSISNERLSEPVQEIARVFDLLIEAETLQGNKWKWQSWKKVICIFLEHDLAYRYRFQWILERININKVKLIEDDKYFFRVKNFRVDLEEEWREAIQKYPQLKGQEDKFKQFLSANDNWFKDEKSRLASLEELAPLFLNKE